MKRLCLFSVWFGIASYCALSLVSGSAGLEAERLQRERIASMNVNIESLALLNARLTAEWKNSSKEPATIMLEARSIGYLAPEEVTIRLPFAITPHHSSPGETILSAEGFGLPDEGIKRTALTLALSVFGAGLALKVFRRGHDDRRH